MGYLLHIVIPLTLFTPANGAARLCNPGPCKLPQSESCSELIQKNKFKGTCCSLVDDSETGGCVVTVSDGDCYWEFRDFQCDPSTDCFPPGTIWLANNDDECPLSTYDPFTEPPPTESPSGSPTESPPGSPTESSSTTPNQAFSAAFITALSIAMIFLHV